MNGTYTHKLILRGQVKMIERKTIKTRNRWHHILVDFGGQPNRPDLGTTTLHYAYTSVQLSMMCKGLDMV